MMQKNNSKDNQRRRKIRTNAFSGASNNNNARVAAASSSAASPLDKMEALIGAIWKFVRPHTIRGTLLGTTALVSKVLIENPELIQLSLFPRALLGLLALLCGNGFIVGINQIYDVEIDKVNKPYLPIAAGELSLPMAWAFCLATAIGGATIVAMNFGPLITSLYTFGLFLGTIYSVPPLRLKRFALPAFMIIATVRGFLLNFGVFHATRAALRLPFVWSPPVLFITIFVTVFATAIAVTKDLADIDGDKQFGIETFTTKMGVKNVSYIGSGLLLMNYVFAIGLSVFNPTWFNQKDYDHRARNLSDVFNRQDEKVGEGWFLLRVPCKRITKTSGNCSTLSTYYFRLFNFIPSCRKRKGEAKRGKFQVLRKSKFLNV